MTIQQKTVSVIKNIPLTESIFKLTFEAKSFAGEIKPGHFLTIGIEFSPIPFLKKPFSIYEKTGHTMSIIYQIKGPGTKQLSLLRPGDLVTVLAPLGNGCNIPIKSDGPIALIGGGIGMASLHRLAQEIHHNCDIFYGAKTHSQVWELDHWKSLVNHLVITTDDGTAGEKGFIADAFSKKISNYHLVYACGPRMMLEKISRLCQEKNIKHYVIMEEYMACGMGVCMGCVLQTKSGYKRVCVDGPIFLGDEIIW